MEKQAKNRTLRERDPERGAALITVVLMSMLVLMAGAALIAVTTTSAVNALDATSESQAYYAAEAGSQAVLGVLRGDDPPLNNFDTTTPANNLISFRKAATPSKSNSPSDTYSKARLSNWLSYSAAMADGTSVVPVSPSFVAGSGMAYTVNEVSDPDNTDVVAFSTSGSLDAGNTVPSNVTITYTPRAATTLYTNTSNTSTLGSFSFSLSGGNNTYTLTNEPFTLTLTQTGPWTITKTIACKISGTVTKLGGNQNGTLTVTFPFMNVGTTSYFLDGVEYKLALATATFGTSPTAVNVTVNAPEPLRLRVRVTGYGPRNAVKQMQMLVSRSGFDYNATATIALRSHDDNSTVLHANIGSSAVFNYNGNDNSNGPALPAFTVTGPQDVAFINSVISAGNQAQGSPASAQQVAVSSLDRFLQTTDGPYGARATLNLLRQTAKNLKTPGCTGTADACDRYFASGESPSNIGLGTTDGLTTFVDGDYTMPPAGGAGLLIVTGTLTMQGNADFKGLVLVLGDGHVERNGGGGDTSLGAMVIAHFDQTSGNFLEPTYNVQGGGGSTFRYDSEWVRKALKSAGPGVLGVSEYGP